jgi:hypothetical protein
VKAGGGHRRRIFFKRRNRSSILRGVAAVTVAVVVILISPDPVPTPRVDEQGALPRCDSAATRSELANALTRTAPEVAIRLSALRARTTGTTTSTNAYPAKRLCIVKVVLAGQSAEIPFTIKPPAGPGANPLRIEFP